MGNPKSTAQAGRDGSDYTDFGDGRLDTILDLEQYFEVLVRKWEEKVRRYEMHEYIQPPPPLPSPAPRTTDEGNTTATINRTVADPHTLKGKGGGKSGVPNEGKGQSSDRHPDLRGDPWTNTSFHTSSVSAGRVQDELRLDRLPARTK